MSAGNPASERIWRLADRLMALHADEPPTAALAAHLACLFAIAEHSSETREVMVGQLRSIALLIETSGSAPRGKEADEILAACVGLFEPPPTGEFH